MADTTVTWKGAVPVDSWGGKVEHLGAKPAIHDPRSVAAGFTIRSFQSENVESAMKGAVPYQSTIDEPFVEEGK